MQGIKVNYREMLESKIENLRQKMHITALEKGISHPDVLRVSQRLDEVIIKFYKINLIKIPYGVDWKPSVMSDFFIDNN